MFVVISAFKKQNQRYHPQRGHVVPSKVEGRGPGVHCDSAFSMGKAQKLGFSFLSEQILAMFVLNGIYFDKSHV